MSRGRGVPTAALTAAALLATLSGCASADPPAVAAVGLDSTGYLGVVMLCDRGRTLTYVDFTASDDSDPSLAWIGRTVEPITFFRLSEEPPDNWVVDVEGGLLSGVTYRFQGTADDLTVMGPQFSLDGLNTLDIEEVIDADGVVLPLEEFLDEGCAG